MKFLNFTGDRINLPLTPTNNLVSVVFKNVAGASVVNAVRSFSPLAVSNLGSFTTGSTQTTAHKASMFKSNGSVVMLFQSYKCQLSCPTKDSVVHNLQAKDYQFVLLEAGDAALIQSTGTETPPVPLFCTLAEYNAVSSTPYTGTTASATTSSTTTTTPVETVNNSAASNELTTTDEEIETEIKRVVASVSTTTNRSIKSYSNAEFLEMFPDAQIRELSSWDENSVISELDEFKDETHAIILGDYTIPLSLKDGLIASIFCDCDTPPMDAFSAYKDLEFTQLAKANAYVEVLTKLSTDADSISVDKTMYEAIKNQLLNNPSLDDLMCSITGMVLHKNFGQVGVEFDIPLNLLVFRDPSFTSVTNNSAEKWSATLADKGILVANRNLISYYSKKEGDKYFVVESSRWTLSSKCTVNLSDDYKVDIHMSSSTTVVKGPENPYKKETESDKTLKFSLLYSDPATTPIKVVMTESGARLQSSI
jgi:hypothetical protein